MLKPKVESRRWERHISTNHTMVEQSKSLYWLKRLTLIMLLALVIKVLASILSEYRWYFPANFRQSFFLTGREAYFAGWYGTAFYIHIITGPITIILAFTLMMTAGQSNLRSIHRWMGRMLGLLVVFAITPSGLVMATRALTGTFAGVGFAALSIGTCLSAITAAYYARNKTVQKTSEMGNSLLHLSLLTAYPPPDVWCDHRFRNRRRMDLSSCSLAQLAWPTPHLRSLLDDPTEQMNQ